MNFDYSQEQRLFLDTVERLVVQQRDKRTPGANAVDLLELGWHGLLVPESMGGVGASMVEATIAMSGLGGLMDCGPLLSTSVIAASIIDRLGNSAQRSELLTAIACGDLRFGCVVDEHPFGDLRLVRDGETLRLVGHAAMVIDAPLAQHLLVPAAFQPDGGSVVAIVSRDAAAHTIREQIMVDGRVAADCSFDGVQIDPDAILSGDGDVRAALQEALDRGRTAVCADAVGAMTELLLMTARHLTTRKQFGVPLSSFQVLRHRFVDMVLEKEQAEAMTLVAAMACDECGSERSRLVRLAKARVGAAARFVGEWAVQMHGGIGLCEEHVAGRLYKRLLVDDILLGCREDMLDHIVSETTSDRAYADNLFFS